MSEKPIDSEGPEYQIGGFGEDITESTSLGDEGEFIEFDYETAAVFKRLADDIYESTEAGIREPLQNGITAVKRAVNEADLKEGDEIINIEAQDGDQVKLSIRDNGIGIMRSVLKEVLAVIGRSQNRDDGELSGKYGMGFLACYKLVGVRGGFLMHSNSRMTDNDPIKGIWKPGGFEMDQGSDNIPDRLGDDEYGTLFEFTLKEEVDISSVRSWVEKHSEWSRIPILYTEYDKDGKEVYNNEFGDKTLVDHYEDDKSVVIEKDDFTAVCSPKADNRSLLINSPIEPNADLRCGYLGWPIDIRMENENGVIVKGPNEGYQPAGDKEYERMSEKRKKSYIPKSELTSNDIGLPKPTGTRDSLEFNSEFWSYLGERFADVYESRISKIIDKLDGKSDYLSLSDDQRRLLNDSINRFSLLYRTNKKTRDAFDNEFGIDISSELIDAIRTSRKKVKVVERGSDARKASRKNTSVTSEYSAMKVYHTQDSGDVYMGATLNQDKMDAVWDDSDKNKVVRVKSSDEYEDLERLFGWNQLRKVKKNLGDMDVSEDIIDRLKTERGTKSGKSRNKNSEKDIKERHLTVHQNKLGSNGFDAKEIKDRYDEGSDHLVLFPSNTEYNLSNHRNIQSSRVGLANCIVKVYDYLSGDNNIYRIEDWYEHCQETKLKTSKGEMKVKKIAEENHVLLHVLGDDVVDVFRGDSVMEEMTTICRDTAIHNGNYGVGLNRLDVDDVTYVPISPMELDKIRVCFEEFDSEIRTMTGDINVDGIGSTESPVGSDIYWYTWARLPRWRDTTEIDKFDNNQWNLNPDWIWLIDQLASSEYELKSISGNDILPPEEVLKFHTNDGYISLSDITENYKTAVLHILPVDTVDAFRTDGVDDDTLKYILENADTGGSYNSEKICEADCVHEDSIVYVPITKSEHSDIESTLNNPEDREYTIGDSRESCSFVITYGEKRIKQRNVNMPIYKIDSDTAAYASSKLSEDVKDATIPIDQHNVLPSLSDGGLEFIGTLASKD